MNLPVVVPLWMRAFHPNRIWQMPNNHKVIYLSFDDGPHQHITPQVLSMLEDYQAKASFFCVGDNVRKYPEVFSNIIQRGHAVGNHSFHHLNGWKTDKQAYVNDIVKANALIQSNLFRPPYGRLKSNQAKTLISHGYEIVMWTLLSSDYDEQLSKEKCAERLLKKIRPGAIVLFHDSDKAKRNMIYALERLLYEGTRQGYRFEALPYKKGPA
ncbi:MAG: polysaccharide deacetylase family protein [Chitinophagaceae bacterium]